MSLCRIVADEETLCGESPLWDARTERLYWVDCLSARLFVYDWTANKHTVLLQGFDVNGVALNGKDGFVFVNNRGVWLWNNQASLPPSPVASEVEGIPLQLNDCIADPRGRLLAGTCFYEPYKPSELGHLVKVETDGSVTILDDGLRLANGLCFSFDSTILHLADSVERVIYAYDYDVSSGVASGKRIFVRIDNSAGLPDGITADAEGFVWVAEWYGGCIKRYDPDGKLERQIAVPAKQTSSLTFGGPDLRDIFITTAAKSEPMPVMPLEYDPHSGYFGGALFKTHTEIRGQIEHRANVVLKKA